jgi:hypothetical protein
MQLTRIVYSFIGILLGLFTVYSYADIYSFVDDKGVRHISNKPNDPRFKRVMKTPEYKKAQQSETTEPAQPDIPQVNHAGAIQLGGSGWKVISPNEDRRALTALSGSNYIKWGKKTGKPFHINEANRRRLSRAIARIAAQYRLDPHLIHAVISAESGFNPNAVSPAGAQGLMQLMPATAKRFGVNNSFDPIANMHGGARYLRWLLNLFKNNVSLALAGYNAGENAVIKYGYKIPPYKETQTYVPRVLRFYQHYRSGKS